MRMESGVAGDGTWYTGADSRSSSSVRELAKR